MVKAKMMKDALCSFQGTSLIRTDSDDAFANRLIVEKRVKLDDPVDICQRHFQGFGNLCGNRLRNPAIHFLSGVQGW
jgi:hypothetical protein